ncbi:uncharacterized protein AB675_10216 [Cyphellophora attinorum]|uniref:Transcription factor domain-containing protein n=1 Tax=Cyphellophora attinorum TaxID=1664694 RepID=A0A0N1NW69_9EURO|nr:uncharacterized protein AB675_10216 [Phialophora attinorum]KPI34773.1 hypothetical protein AB675_10216 [Phialophora attinorum]
MNTFMRPMRDATLEIVASNEIVLIWAIVVGLHRQETSDRHALLLERRILTYRVMARRLKDVTPSMISSDILYGLAYAALVEYRIGERAAAQKHLQACLSFRRLRKDQSWPHPQEPFCLLADRYPCIRRALTRDPRSNPTARQDEFDRIWLATVLLINVASNTLFERYGLSAVNDFIHLIEQASGGAPSALDTVTDIPPTHILTKFPAMEHWTTTGLLHYTFYGVHLMATIAPKRPCHQDLWRTVEVLEALAYAPPSMLAAVKSRLLYLLPLNDYADQADHQRDGDAVGNKVLKNDYTPRNSQNGNHKQDDAYYRSGNAAGMNSGLFAREQATTTYDWKHAEAGTMKTNTSNKPACHPVLAAFDENVFYTSLAARIVVNWKTGERARSGSTSGRSPEIPSH